MPAVRNIFSKGKMSSDIDERLIEKGDYRYAKNISVSSNNGESVGAIKKALSNKQISFLDIGESITTIGAVKDDFKNRVFWLVKSELGCYILEYDQANNDVSIILEDTRTGENNALGFNEKYLVTGISVITDHDNNKTFLLFTDNYTQPKQINIERARAFGANNFTEEQILLIKKPPIQQPTIVLGNNEDEESTIKGFISFAYRYKYIDGEYSALSPFSQIAFLPDNFKFDYSTSSNESMVNQYNKVDVSFNTGGELVKEIELLFKGSEKDTLYVIDRYNKEKEGWQNNSVATIEYSKNKSYRSLSESQLFRLFDNVPLRAKTLDVINNILVFGNWIENYNLIDHSFNQIKLDFNLSYTALPITASEPHQSCKSNMLYEAAIVYLDEYGRMTTPLISQGNSVFINSSDCIRKNKLSMVIKK